MPPSWLLCITSPKHLHSCDAALLVGRTLHRRLCVKAMHLALAPQVSSDALQGRQVTGQQRALGGAHLVRQRPMQRCQQLEARVQVAVQLPSAAMPECTSGWSCRMQVIQQTVAALTRMTVRPLDQQPGLLPHIGRSVM